ncbi:MAG: two-component system sensor histidine kinase NtrB [Desulfonatronovibrio sp.]
MDIGISKRLTGIMLFLVVGFFILGMGLIILTWQNLRQQQDHVFEQLEVTGRAIIRSVEANLYSGVFRGMRRGRMMEEGEFADLARDVLEELVAEGEVVFLDISGVRGRLFISRYEDAAKEFQPSDAMLEMAASGVWSDTAGFMGKEVFIMGIPASRLDMMSRGRRSVQNGTEHHQPGEGVIFIALDMSEYLGVYSGFRQTIILQTIFTLGAILLFWILLLAFLNRKEQGQKFIRLRSFHSRLLDNMPDGLLSIDQNETVTAANPAARKILGAGQEVIGQKLSEAMPWKLNMDSGRGWTQIDLEDKSLEILFLPIKEEKQSLILIRDRTRMKELEKDLEHSRDLATLGRFAAGLAHEIRNPLSSLRGFAQYFQKKFSKDDPAHAYARTMVLESDRLNRVITDLLYLARPRAINPVMIDLKELFDEVLVLLRPDINAKTCRIVIDLKTETVQADRDLLKQALINLMINSLNAIEDKGQIVLGSSMKQDIKEISVSDNGQGMDPETRQRAMEPFFSARDGGTGLGLAIVQRIVRDHKGGIEMDSAPGKGTRVSLLFQNIPGKDEYEK